MQQKERMYKFCKVSYRLTLEMCLLLEHVPYFYMKAKFGDSYFIQESSEIELLTILKVFTSVSYHLYENKYIVNS